MELITGTLPLYMRIRSTQTRAVMSTDDKQNRSIARENSDRQLPEGTNSEVVTRRVDDAGVIHTVTDAVVDAREQPMDELPPLGSIIDGDALESFWRDMGPATGYTVSFQYAECEVSVMHDRVRVEASPPKRETDSPGNES